MLRIGQVEATATQDGKYTDGSVAGGIAATRLRAAAFNAMQEELAHIVESAGLALDINDMTQVLKAIQKLTLSRANPFADIKSDGAAAISTALTNLDLGEGSALPVGVPVPYPLATPPTGWMKCNGSSFNLASYPKLAAVFPSG
ncbi:phage tail protein, partial [Escherichia coli]|uniref:phage tail protein n=1 Tax=Escherichia coli TaxID=562 RepID=UPI0010CC7E89